MEDVERVTFENSHRRREAETLIRLQNERERQELEGRKAARMGWYKECLSNACYLAGGFFCAVMLASQTSEAAGLAALAGIMFVISANGIAN